MATQVAKGTHNHPHYKLGSILGSGAADKRTVTLSDFVSDKIEVPASWDFDKGKKPFPGHMWGNDQYGDCEIAGRANYLVRLARQQTKTTPGLTDDDAINLYKQMTGCVSPGDNNDTGLTTVANLSQWRSGWNLSHTDWGDKGTEGARDYEISAYGLVNHKNHLLLHQCMYLFSGALFGVALPVTAQAQMENHEPWDVVPDAGPDGEPGSWGGHCIYAVKYNKDGVTVITWNERVLMTNAFIDKYAMEAYSVVDSFETWFKHPHAFDAQAMIAKMREAGINVEQ